MEYKDENGKVMYGYSQKSLDKNTFWTKVNSIATWGLLAYILYITWYVIHNNVVNNIVAEIVKALIALA